MICSALVSMIDSFSALRSMSVTSPLLVGLEENARPIFCRNDFSVALLGSSFISFSIRPLLF